MSMVHLQQLAAFEKGLMQASKFIDFAFDYARKEAKSPQLEERLEELQTLLVWFGDSFGTQAVAERRARKRDYMREYMRRKRAGLPLKDETGLIDL